MVRCGTCNNLSAEALPAGPSSYRPSSTKSFVIERRAGEFEDSAALGCATCSLVLQAIRRYIDTVGSKPYQNDSELDKIVLEGDCNEPLRVSFQRSSTWTDLELFEERVQSAKDNTPLYPAVGLGSTPPEVLDIEFAARLASQWISRCDQEHSCVGRHVPFFPSRVLDVNSDPVKLITPTASTTGYYAALSYCWGSAGNLTTTSHNLDKRKAGITWDDFPKLIQEVIHITRRLGIRYLWVDALCIVQNDKEDWRAESSKMGDIYAGAYLTIAADAATDTFCRLTSPRNSPIRSSSDREVFHPETSAGMRAKKRIEIFPPLVADGRAHSLCVREPWWHYDIIGQSTSHDLTCPLNTRGWALQERLFSSRVLHFAAHEMIWECKRSLNCECEGILQESGLEHGHESPKAKFETAKAMISREHTIMSSPRFASPGDMLQHREFAAVWTELVSAYSARHLTVESDRLPAMSALARHFSQGRAYLAGLWANDLPWHLVWCCENLNKAFPRPTSVYSGPTWSWASTTEKISWPPWIHQARSRVQVLEASTAPMSLNEFGEVSWGRIRLRARVAVARVAVPGNRKPRLVTFGGDRFHVQPDVGRGEKKLGSDQRTLYNLSDHEDVWCLLLFDDVADNGYVAKDRSLWVMVAAKPNDKSIRRAGLDPDAYGDTIICERLGHMERLNWVTEFEKARKWVDGPDFKEREVILI